MSRWILVALGALSACKTKVSAPLACGDGALCGAGQVCIADVCRTVCNTSSDCGADSICASGVCVSAEAQPDEDPELPQPPSITSIDGTGSVDGAVGHTSRHLRDRLVINGTALDGSSVVLTNGTTQWALTLCEAATPTRLTVSLPSDVAEGQYTLTVTNQAGSCSSNLSLLQGEPGSVDASAAQIVGSINDAMALDPQLRLLGSLYGKVTTLALASSAGSAAGRTITVNGAQLVDATRAGLFLAIVDADSHELVSFVNGQTVRTVYAMTDSLERTTLRTLLDNLTDDQIVLVVSTGDVSALSGDAQLVAAMKSIGASPAVEELASTDGYALVGMPGIGEGNGLEQIGGVDRAGVTALSTVLVNGGIVGMRTSKARPAHDVACDSPGCVEDSDIAGVSFSKISGVPSFASPGQACTGTQKVTGIDASGDVICGNDVDTDTNTTYSGTNFATSNQTCSGTQKVTGISASGAVICGNDVDTNTTYSGANFATSNQACSGTQKVTGISASGGVICGNDVDTDTNTTYSGANFATSNQACSGSQKVTGISASGAVICGGDVDTDTNSYCTFSGGGTTACDGGCCQTGVTYSYVTISCPGQSARTMVTGVSRCFTDCCCGCNCFSAGTLVRLAEGGDKKIEDIQVGEVLLGQGGSRNQVLALDRHPLGHRDLFAINGGEAFVTEDHPFMTPGGWKSINPELTRKGGSTLKLGKLGPGDVILGRDREVRVESITAKRAAAETTVYNFVLDGTKTYYANGYLVSAYNELADRAVEVAAVCQ